MILNVARLSLCLLIGSLFAACTSPPRLISEYKIDIQQGNVLNQDVVAQLKPGQTKDQVRYLLGTPLITDVFHQSRWDYVYTYKNGATGQEQTRNVSVFFNQEGLLERLAGDVEEADVPELTMTPSKSRMVDLGALSADAPGLDANKPGIFRRMMNMIGL